MAILDTTTLDNTSQANLASKTLQRAEKEFKAIFDQSNDGIIIVREGVFTDCNLRICEMFGYSKKRFLKNTPMDLSPEYQPSGRKSLDGIGAKIQAAMGGEVQEFYWKHKNKEGELFDTDVTVCRFTIEVDIYLQIIVRDTTEIRRTKEILGQKVNELERYMASNNELKQFAHTTAHDLKEPLRSIGSFTRLLDKQCHDKMDETGKEYMGFITKGVENMTQLIHDLLNYSKLDGQQEGRFKSINIQNNLYLITHHNLKTQIEESQATIHFKNLPETITGLPPKITQLFQNLITNAIKFCKKDTPCKITIKAKEIENVYLFEVSDNGIGIAENDLSRIFEVFTKLHSKETYQGSGIGLATCKKIVQQHGGKIWATSQFGEGSTFSFTLPK
ncbi:MAG: PAS domain-containing sensor histidine kinase [Chitinophagales bacterium]